MSLAREKHSRRKPAFDVFYSHGWVYLIVQPNERGTSTVYPDEIQNRMRMIGMPRVSTPRLREVVERAAGEPEPLIEWPEGEQLASNIHVDIDEDEMSAAVSVSRPGRGAAPPSVGDVVGALEAAGVTFGIDRDAIDRLLCERAYDDRRIVAEGAEPVFGRSRRVEYRFKLERGKPYLEMPFQRINLKELNFIDNRSAGDLLAVLLPPVEPQDGSTVTAGRIPAERDDTVAQIPAGENTKLSVDGTELYAAIDGNVRFREGLVIIEEIVEVENVDYSTGNIHFDGSVVVKGEVADGFEVEASGNIQVGKGVGKAHLHAGENVLLVSGMNGNNDGSIDCAGNLFARYVESATVRCRGNVLVEEAIMHSHVTVWGHCLLNGRRAEVIAGDAIVGGSFWCKKLGNIYDAPTHVAIGTPPEMIERYRDLQRELVQTEARAEELQENAERLDRAIRDGHTDERYATARAQVKNELEQARVRVSDLRRRVHSTRDRLEASHESVVVAEEVLYNGSVVTFGLHEYRTPQSGSWKTVLRMSHGEVHATNFDPHDPPTIAFDGDPEQDETYPNGG